MAVVGPEGTAQAHMYALRAGALLHEFRIDAVLGHGGFGITYRALDTALRKTVAIKEYLPNELAGRASDTTVRAKSRDDQQQFEQGVVAFLDEARLVARLQHKNIMEVLRFFKANGTGYIVLRYEQGRTLKQRLDEGPLSESELRHVLGGLLDGIEVLHNEAILHRDIKPSNIILSDSRVPGERGVPVLIDFGAARDFRSRHSRSVTTIVAPGYAPPEQYGIGGQAGPWSDLYALGATAYRCVTGQAPPEALRRLRKDPYVPAIEAAAGRYDENLLHLIDQMLAVDEADRPQSAGEVKAELNSRGVLRSRPKPSRERRPTASYAAKEPKRSLGLVGILGAVGVIAAIAIGATLWVDGTLPKLLVATEVKTATAPAPTQTVAPPAPKEAEAPKVEAAPKLAETPNANASPKLANAAEAPKVVTATAAQEAPPPVVKRTLVDAVAAGFEPVVDVNRASIKSLAFSPDGRILASGAYHIRLWDLASGQELWTSPKDGCWFISVVFSPDGRTLASSSQCDREAIKLWDVASGLELRTIQTGDGPVKSIALSPDGRILVSISTHIHLWDVASGQKLRPLDIKTYYGPTESIAFSPNGRILASGYYDGLIHLWDVASRRELPTLKHGDNVRDVAFSPDSRTLASWSAKAVTVKLWDVASGRELRAFKGAGSVAFSPDGRTLASGGDDKTVILWNVASGRELRTLSGHGGPVVSVVFSPDGRTLASGSEDDGIINLWSIPDGSLRARYIGGAFAGAVTLDGKGLPIAVSGNEDEVYHFVKNGKTIKPGEMRAMGYDLPAPRGHNGGR